jgi:hypothetical protein
MRVQVRKCPFTGIIFEEHNRNKYVSHLAELRSDKKEARRLASIRASYDIWLKNEKLEITSPTMVMEWFLENQRFLMDAFNSGVRGTDSPSMFSRAKFYPNDKFTALELQTSTYGSYVSNTHVCPDDGITNWGCKPDKPIGYPGWSIRLGGSLYRDKKHNGSYPYSELINMVGIKTGSGGGGNESWSYDASLFLADWSGLSEARLFDKLKE